MSDPSAPDPAPVGGQRRGRALTPDALREAVEDLVDVLIDRGVPARLTIYGGAAMALVHYERAATGDVDASFLPPEEVAAAARDVAGRRGLAGDWLNSSATGFLPPVPDEHETPVVVERGGVIVSAGSAPLLLAMKLRASRPGRDGDDIAVLVRACGVCTVAEAQQVMDEINSVRRRSSPAGTRCWNGRSVRSRSAWPPGRWCCPPSSGTDPMRARGAALHRVRRHRSTPVSTSVSRSQPD